jgi:hypothetical protein
MRKITSFGFISILHISPFYLIDFTKYSGQVFRGYSGRVNTQTIGVFNSGKVYPSIPKKANFISRAFPKTRGPFQNNFIDLLLCETGKRHRNQQQDRQYFFHFMFRMSQKIIKRYSLD